MMFGRKAKEIAAFLGRFEFSDECRGALNAARDEAVRMRLGYVGTEHILIGAAMQPGGAALLGRFGVTADGLRARTEQMYVVEGRGRTVADPLGPLPYTSRTKHVLVMAIDESRLRGSATVDVPDLLAGIVREVKSLAAVILSELGVTLDRVREAARTAEPAAPKHGLRIDDASDVSIYEQLVSQVREGVATGRLRPGERLPSVRSLADELDIAPGTVARAYAELERLGVVVTGGARGTRIAEPPDAPRSEAARPENLAGLLRPVVVAAFHLGATAADLRDALERAMKGILNGEDGRAPAG
ncbi:MAG TPA: Clp protease N-terminal domain-containing protein [Longimicrobium sp.]|nr:Clp protease N-terminal domain-containing protein [Longimicrobium sp.]